MNKIEEEDAVFVNALMTKTMEKRVRIAAAIQGVSKSEIVRRAVADYLKIHRDEFVIRINENL